MHSWSTYNTQCSHDAWLRLIGWWWIKLRSRRTVRSRCWRIVEFHFGCRKRWSGRHVVENWSYSFSSIFCCFLWSLRIEPCRIQIYRYFCHIHTLMHSVCMISQYMYLWTSSLSSKLYYLDRCQNLLRSMLLNVFICRLNIISFLFNVSINFTDWSIPVLIAFYSWFNSIVKRNHLILFFSIERLQFNFIESKLTDFIGVDDFVCNIIASVIIIVVVVIIDVVVICCIEAQFIDVDHVCSLNMHH